MRLTVTDCNFFKGKDWIFELKDTDNVSFYILSENSYRSLKLKSPVTKQHWDVYNIGTIVEAEVERSDERNIVVSIL